MIRSASRQAMALLAERQQAVLGRVSANTLTEVAGELYSVGALLVGQPRLRRILGDPATDPSARSALAAQLVASSVSERTMEIVAAAVSSRWSSPWDLCDALESAGDDALFAAADKDGLLDNVEDELFRVGRILDGEGTLTGLLDEQSVSVVRRLGLLDSILARKVSPITLSLLQHAVASDRKRGLALAIDNLLEQAAARRERSVARVISAVALTTPQQARLAAALGEIYGREISLRAAIDPTVRGGLVVRVGDEVIDGTVAARMAEVRAAFAG